MNRNLETSKKNDDTKGSVKKQPPLESIEKLRWKYRHLIEKFELLNTNDAYDAILEFLYKEVEKLDWEKETTNENNKSQR